MQLKIVNVTGRTTDWNSVNWRNAFRVVRRLRQRIFKATIGGNLKKVGSLQKLLMRSYSNILLSVRRVTQLNQGSKTAGVDRLLVKTPAARGLLVDILTKCIPWKPLPVKRVYIRKSNGKQRPLGIPCIVDSCSVDFVIGKLNPIIRGIANYYRTVVSSQIFSSLDRWMFVRERRYAKRMHAKKNQSWCNRRYWVRLNLDRSDYWVFGNKRTGKHLLKFSWFNIRRHPMVKGAYSTDDPELKSYWENRQNIKSKSLIPSYHQLAQKQNFKCPVCGESLLNDEPIQKHHKIPCHQGGNDSYANLELVHYYCHQQIHSLVQKPNSELDNELSLW